MVVEGFRLFIDVGVSPLLLLLLPTDCWPAADGKMACVPPHTAGQTCASHFPALYSFTFFSRKTSSLCISMVTLQFSLYLYFLGYLSLLGTYPETYSGDWSC